MKTILICLLCSLLSINDASNMETSNDSLIGNWLYSESINSLSGIEVCHHYSLSFQDDNRGVLKFHIYYLEDSEVELIYVATTPFSFKSAEEESVISSNNIIIEFEKAVFRPLVKPRYPIDKKNYPPLLHIHIEEMEQLISNAPLELEYSVEGRDNLIVQGFSVVEDRSFVEFRRPGSRGNNRCEH